MQYYQLGRAAFGLDSILEETSIIGIQALVHKVFLFTSELFLIISAVLDVPFHVFNRYVQF